MNSVRELRVKRHQRVRQKIEGTPDKPRLSVFRSNRHLYAQLIDDRTGVTLVAASTMEPAIRGKERGSSVGAAKQVGTLVAERAIEKGLNAVVFDRGGFRFHGKVKALADAAREKGLKF